MSKHTPRPWYVDPTGDNGPWTVGDASDDIANCSVRDCSDDEMNANALLIAAAPDLLKAAEKATPWIDDRSIRAQLEAAIKKATGD